MNYFLRREDDQELYLEVAKYRKISQITRKGTLGIVGQTVAGETVLFPDSFQRGYEYELTPYHERTQKQFEAFGLMMGTSDGHLNFVPSFNQGRELAREVKTYAIVNKIREIASENHTLKNTVNELKDRLNKFLKDKS